MFGQRQSGVIADGLSAFSGDQALLKTTHDLAREILRRPDSEASGAVLALARESFLLKFEKIALN